MTDLLLRRSRGRQSAAYEKQVAQFCELMPQIKATESHHLKLTSIRAELEQALREAISV
jgi:hypothetical protein